MIASINYRAELKNSRKHYIFIATTYNICCYETESIPNYSMKNAYFIQVTCACSIYWNDFNLQLNLCQFYHFNFVLS